MNALQKARTEWIASQERQRKAYEAYLRAVREAERNLLLCRRARLGQGLVFLKPQAE